MKIFIVAVALIVLSAGAALAAPDAPSAKVEVTEAQDNQTVTVAVDGTVKIRLASNMAQGRRWHLLKVNRELLAVKSVSYQQNSIKQPFAGGYDEFVLRVVKAGSDQLVISLENGKEQLKTWQLTIVAP